MKKIKDIWWQKYEKSGKFLMAFILVIALLSHSLGEKKINLQILSYFLVRIRRQLYL